MDKGNLESLLMDLGLSGLEAETYLALVAEPGSTGYRVSQVLGKAAPNTYRALDSLLAKGAVVADEADRGRAFAPVPVRELVRQMSSRLETIAEDIEKGLSTMHVPEADQGVYRLRTVHQVMARAGEMVASAESSIVVDADDDPMGELRDGFQRAASRGVNVLLHGRSHFEIAGCECVASVTEGWPGNMLVVVADEREYLVSFMSEDGRVLHHAAWSSNFLAPCMYRGYMVKALFYRIAMMLGEGSHDADGVRQELLRLWRRWGYEGEGREALTRLLEKPQG